MPNVPAFFVHAGVKLNSIALEFTRSGAAATINAVAQGETRFGATQVNWPPFRPDTWHEQGGLGISPSTGLCRTSTVGSR
jgi:hypothetical protein